jgi:hypothetical protein
LRRHLDEIEVELLGLAQRLGRGHDPDLLPVGPDQANLGRPDPIVYAWFSGNPESPPWDGRKNHRLLGAAENEPSHAPRV